MYCVYVLSLEDKGYYVGCTTDFKRRVRTHLQPQAGGLQRTVKSKPVKLVALGIYEDEKEALIREKELQKFYSRQARINRGLINATRAS